WRLSTGLSITQAGKDVLGLRRFAAFLADTHTECTTPASLDRELIERYLAWLSLTRPVAKGRGGEIGSLAGLLRATQQHRWLDDLPATAAIFAEDYPRQPEAPSRALSGFVMSQLESEANLARFAEARFRLLTELLQRAGLRVGDARRLKTACLRRDEQGADYLAYRNHKMRRDAVVPIDDALATAIAAQQQVVRDRWPDGPVLFPMIYANPDGTRPISRAAYATQLKKWLTDCDVRDESRSAVAVTPHQFRHTYATTLINLDVPQHVVKKLLDHDSDTMTAHYARLNQTTVRRHWEAARKVSISGEITIETAGPLADAAWLKNSLSRAKMALPNGYCTLPLQQTCEYANACLTCPMFLTTADFLPQHHQQLTETRALLEHAERHDQQRVLQMNQTVERNLLNIITTLERPVCSSQSCVSTGGCGCRSQSGGNDAS
ncbi:MAG: transposase, partial [Pseudonocardiales bacterium]